MNKIILTGIVGKDPVCTVTTEKKVSVAKFTLAVARDRDSTKTDWFNIVTFSNVENFVKPFVKKGTKIMLIGSFEIESYTRSDGTQGKSYSVVTERIEICSTKQNTTEPVADISNPTENNNAMSPVNDDELPF